MKFLSKKFILFGAIMTSSPAVLADNAFEWDGYFMLDYNRFANAFSENQEADESIDLRRARLKSVYDFNKDWSAKLQLDLSDGIKIKDANIKYDGWGRTSIILGQQKEPFGLENLTSSQDIFLMERSIVSSALSPGRSIGALMSNDNKGFGWRLGYFIDDLDNKESAITGRMFWSSKDKQQNVFHLGTAFSERRLDDHAWRINENLELAGADSVLEGKWLEAKGLSQQGAELLWQYHGFAAMAEWQQAEVEDNNNTNYRYHGGYYQLSYRLSGQNRPYKNGEFKGIYMPGEWEFSFRMSQFDLEKEDRNADITTLGANYFLSKEIKLMANYIQASYIGKSAVSESDKAFSFRFQMSF